MPANPAQPRCPVVRALTAGAADRAALARCKIDPASQLDDGFDYSRVVVRKKVCTGLSNRTASSNALRARVGS